MVKFSFSVAGMDSRKYGDRNFGFLKEKGRRIKIMAKKIAKQMNFHNVGKEKKRISKEEDLSIDAIKLDKIPRDLSNKAQTLYKNYVELYWQMKDQVVCDLDKNTLKRLCIIEAQYYYYNTQINNARKTTKGFDEGDPKYMNMVSQIIKLDKQIHSYQEELLLTPIARAKLAMKEVNAEPKPITKDEWLKKYDL